jgi:CHAT domain
VRPKRSKFVLPWGLCYDIPLDSKKAWTVCPAVDQWDEARPLFTGTPRACPHDHPRHNILCPFGFIGLRHAIEQPPSADKPALEIACTPRCDFAVAETQYQLEDPKALEAHITALRELSAAAKPPAQLAEGKTRDAVEKLLGADLSLVYFFCHGNRLHIRDPNIYLAVGNDEAISADDFISWFERWANELARPIWGDVRPLIFINACHSLAIEPETLVSYLDAFVTWGHAAGVIGTEVKVAQPLAIDVAEQFFRRLLGRTHTVETALHEIRVDYLASGNLFGLVYTPYCWADLRMEPAL